MTLHGVRPGVVEVRDGIGVRLAVIEHRTGLRCVACPDDGYWIIRGRVGHHHRAVHAFKEVIMDNEV